MIDFEEKPFKMASKTFEAVKLQPTATVGIALLAVLVVRALMKFYYHRRMVAGLVSASQSRFHRKKSFADSSNLARTSSWIPPWAYVLCSILLAAMLAPFIGQHRH